MPRAWVERVLEALPLRWVFEVFYLSSRDPWRYWRSDFEQARYDAALSLLERHAPPRPRLLEVGCSVGAFTHRLLGLAPQDLTAMDISSMALRRARRALRPTGHETRVEFVCADVFQGLPPGGPYDVVIAMDVLGYTDDRALLSRVGERLRACLAPGGMLLVGNTKLRAHDGEGFEPFSSGFPKLGAQAILACLCEGAARIDGRESSTWRLDLLRPGAPDGS